MVSQASKINVLIAGATGTLGSLITKHCLTKPNLLVNILARNPQKNKELTAQVEGAGGKVIKADVTQLETLKGITKGMHTVIIALDDHAAGIAQMPIIKDCLENNVERIVPAEFANNPKLFHLEEYKDFPATLTKIQTQEYLKTVPIKTLNVNTGILFDWFIKDYVAKGIEYWGEADNKIQFTTYEDTAKVVAAAVARKDQAGDIAFASNDVTMDELAEIYNKVRGTNIKAKRLGSFEELKVQAENQQKQGDPYAKLGPIVYDPRGRFEKIQNSEFPEVKPTSIEQYLKQNPDIHIRA